jgi:hypothetical protein
MNDPLIIGSPRRWLAILAFAATAACAQPVARPADPARIPAGKGWFASTVDLGACDRTCQTRPGAMLADGTAPVSPCASASKAWCVTYEGPGGPVRCWCEKPRCESERAALLKADFGAPLQKMSDCTPLE